jgi:hypothetical protein
MNGVSSTKTKVLRLRLKDKHAQFLGGLAREVNFVCNSACNARGGPFYWAREAVKPETISQTNA